MNRYGTLGFLSLRIGSIHWRELESAILDLYYIPWVFCWISGSYLRRLLVPAIFGVDLRIWRRVQAPHSSFAPCRMLAGGHSPKDLFTIEDPTTFFPFFCRLDIRMPRSCSVGIFRLVHNTVSVSCDAQDIPWLSSAFGPHHLSYAPHASPSRHLPTFLQSRSPLDGLRHPSATIWLKSLLIISFAHVVLGPDQSGHS